jgi:hypothetical protein
MNRRTWLAAMMLSIAPALAVDYACVNACTAQGAKYGVCVTQCGQTGAIGIPQQQGIPTNPMDPRTVGMPPQVGPKRSGALPGAPLTAPQYVPGSQPQYLPGCLDDCAAMGYKRSHCRKQCGY